MKISVGFKRYFKNTSWLFFERIFRQVVSFFVAVFIARYLGPVYYGTLNYAISFVFLFTAVATLGLDNILVRNLVKKPRAREELLGTTFWLKLVGSFLLIGLVFVTTQFVPNDLSTNWLIYIISFGIIFRSFETIEFYFRAKVQGRYIAYSRIITSFLISAIKILLVIFKADLIYFALTLSFEYLILAVSYLIIYKKKKLNILNWKPKLNLAKQMLKDSWPLVLSGIAVSVYMRIDQIMIKSLLDLKKVGIYAVVVKMSEVWYFIPIVLTQSIFPAIINAKKMNQGLYYKRLKHLYALITWLAIIIALPFTLFSDFAIKLLFGSQYLAAGSVLKIYIWSSLFVFLGVASGKYLIAENYTNTIFFRTFIGLIVNIGLNILLIPKYGIEGAALATVISQFMVVFSMIFIKKTRLNTFYMFKSFMDIKEIREILTLGKDE